MRHRRRVRRRRRIRWGQWIALGVLLLLLFAVLSLVPALEARRLLTQGRSAMEAGRDAVLAGQVDAADAHFAEAESAFIRARSHATSPTLRLTSSIPLVGRTPGTVRDMSEAGMFLAQAGRVITRAAADLPGGIATLAPTDGRIDPEPLALASGPLDRASGLVAEAREAFDRTPDNFLLPPVAEANARFDDALQEAERVVHPAAAVAVALPEFLGLNGPRRYFFGAQDPAELRGTGGLIGAYSILRVRGGSLRFTPFSTIQSLHDPSAEVEPPNPDYAALYGQFGAPNFWQNLNMSPDVPSTALAIERLYEEVTGRPVDGVILADPAALAALMEVTGPVRVPLTGDRLTAENAVPYLTNEAFARFPDGNTRKRLLGEAARAVFTRFLSGAARSSPEEAARALVEAAGGGHLLLHSADPGVQVRLEEAGVTGSFPRPEGDFLAVVANNGAGNKADYWAQRSVSYRVTLGADGTAAADTTVQIANRAPVTGYPSHVIGPYSDEFVAGENVTHISTYCAPGCQLERFQVDGEPQRSLTGGEELGHPMFWHTMRLLSDQRQRVAYRWSVPDAWQEAGGIGIYDLTVRQQATIQPTALRVDVAVPEGTRITEVTDGMRVEGDRAVWEGDVTDVMRFRVKFESPIVSRLWRSVVRFWNEPLFER